MKESEERDSHKLDALKIVVPILLLLIIMPTISKAATLTDTFKFGLEDVDKFLNNKDNRYLTIIDFLFFSLLFVSVYLIGVKYAFKELKRAEKTIVILLGVMTAYLLVLADISVTYLLPYIHYIFYFLLFLLYWWMLKGLKSKFWRFVLALLLTVLTIWLLSGLIEGLTGGQAGVPKVGGIGGIFSSLGNAFSGIKLPSISAPQIPSITPPQPGQAGGGTTGTPTPPEILKTQSGIAKFAKNNWWMILIGIIIAIFLIFFAPKLLEKRREKRKKAQSDTASGPLTVEQILERINKIIQIKNQVLERIAKISSEKEKLDDSLREFYHKMVRTKMIRDPSFLRDKESPEYKELEKEGILPNIKKRKTKGIEGFLEKPWVEQVLKNLNGKENNPINVTRNGEVYQ